MSSERMAGDGSNRQHRGLSVCYVAPGQNLLTSAGPTRNVISLATSLAHYASVSVAFRSVLDEIGTADIDVLQIDPRPDDRANGVCDDAAVRGLSVAEFIRYGAAIRRFVRRELQQFDVVLEKSWTLSGFVASECRKIGVPAIVIENLVPVHKGQSAPPGGLMKRAKVLAGKFAAGRYLRNAERIIAETGMLRRSMVDYWRIPEERISVVPLGVDRERFCAMNQAEARRQLGLDPAGTILLYAGVLDVTHNLRPAVAALAAANLTDVELHIIGDGVLRENLERITVGGNARIHFHGRVPYESVPTFIGAADLCLAPYEPDAFVGGEIAYSSLKIPEYMSVGRPVVSVPSGRVLELVEDGHTGFLFANTDDEWRRFVANLPSRERLAAMAENTQQTELDSWDDVARAYLTVCQNEVSRTVASRNRRS